MPNNLNFAVHLDTKEFDKNIREAEALAKRFNITMSTALDFSKKLKGWGTMSKQMADAYSKMITAQAKANAEAAKENVLKEKANVERLKGVKLQQQITNAAKGTRGALSGINSELSVQSRLLSNVKTLFTTYVSVFAVKNFLQELAQVRGEFELQQVALRAIMQDAKAADKTFEQLKGLAIESPFTFSELASYAKMLSAYNIANDELFDTTKRLADLSAGLGVDMQRIILAYGQVRSAAFLRGQEVRQFSEAGINLVGELAKQFSELEGRVVSASETFDKISKREVPFAMVKKVLDDLTSEGGRFYDQQRIQAETTYGMLRKLSDTYMQMLNDIGQSNDGVIKDSIQVLLDLMKNWRQVSAAVMTVVNAYIAYKATGILQHVYNHIAALNRLVRMQGAATVAQKLLNKTIKANPLGLVISLITGAVTALLAFTNANKETAQSVGELQQAVIDEGQEVNHLVATINDHTASEEKRKKAFAELASLQPKIVEGLNDENIETAKLTENVKKYNDELIRRNVLAKYEDKLSEKIGAANTAGVNLGVQENDIRKFLLSIQSKLQGGELKVFKTLENLKNITLDEAGLDDFRDQINNIIAGTGSWYEKLVQVNDLIGRSPNKYTFNGAFDVQTLVNGYDRLKKTFDKANQAVKAARDEVEDYKKSFVQIFDGATDSDEGLVEWQKKFNEIINNLNIPKDIIGRFLIQDNKTSRSDAINKIKEELKTATDELAVAKKLEIVDKDEVKRAEDYLAIVQKIASTFNISLDSNKKGSKKNPILEQIKAELQTLEKARSLYENLRKTQSEDSALGEVKKQFGIKVDDASFNAARQDILNRLLALGDDARDVAIKLSIDIAKDASDKLKQQLDNAKTEYDEYLKNFDFYKSLHQSGMSKEQAIKLSFDIDSNDLKSSLHNIQEYISKTFNKDIRLFDDTKPIIGQIHDIKKVIGREMQDIFGSGNVDLLNRPIIDAQKLLKKGWENVGDGIATLFSSQYGILDKNANEVEILVTPILPDGSVLSPAELEDYVHNTLQGNDILSADDKKIVISVGVSTGGVAGDILHQMQDVFYNIGDYGLKSIPEKLQEYISDTFKLGGKSAPQLDFSINADPIKAQLTALGIEWESLTDKEKDAINAAIGYQQTAIKSAQDVQQALEEWGMEDFNIGEGGIYAINKLLHDLSMQEKKAKKSADELRLSNQLKYEEGNITEEVYNENLARIEYLYDKELEYIKRNSQARLDGMAQSIADEFQSKSGYNKTLASKGNALFSGNYKEALNALRDFQKNGFTDEQKQRLQERGLDENVVAEATEKMLKATKNEELAAKFNETSSAAATMSQAMTALGNDGLATAFSMMSDVAGIAGNIASGNYMQAAASAITMVTNIIAQNKAANEAAAQSAWEYAEALKELNRERLLESTEGIFGTNDMAQLKAYGKIMRDARESANSALSEKKTVYDFSGNTIDVNRFENITSDLRSGWQKFWGSSKNQVNLATSDIYDEFGNIDVDKLSAWYDAYSEGLSKKDKRFVEGLINDLQAYEEALEGMKDYISGIFDNLASDITDSMIESFKATGNAVADLEDVFDDLGETILKSLLQSIIMDKVLNEYEDKVFGLYEDFSKGGMSEEEFANKASGLLSEIEGATMNLGDFWNKILEYVKDTGLTNLTDENATSLGGTIQGITENTAELLGSYLNAIRQAVLKQYPQFIYANNTLIGIWGEMEEFYPTCTEYLHNIEAHSANILETTKEILGVLKGVVSPSGYKLRIE